MKMGTVQDPSKWKDIIFPEDRDPFAERVHTGLKGISKRVRELGLTPLKLGSWGAPNHVMVDGHDRHARLWVMQEGLKVRVRDGFFPFYTHCDFMVDSVDMPALPDLLEPLEIGLYDLQKLGIQLDVLVALRVLLAMPQREKLSRGVRIMDTTDVGYLDLQCDGLKAYGERLWSTPEQVSLKYIGHHPRLTLENIQEVKAKLEKHKPAA